jgi:hypothetical protein
VQEGVGVGGRHPVTSRHRQQAVAHTSWSLSAHESLVSSVLREGR